MNNIKKQFSKIYDATDLNIPKSEVSAGAMLVCKGLQKHGFDGYLVGGCVRDWMLGLHPKDFDVVTNATPEQARKLFKRARIIGRRFKLVHVYHHRELIEVATYRAASTNKSQHLKKSESGRVLRDNVYGTLEQDAHRRDFSLNALYYDPIKHTVTDFMDGVQDLKEGDLRLIGDPKTRFAEDPVRMLRALRFKAKLGFELSTQLEQLIQQNRHRFKEVSNARLFDEMFKLFHHAHAIKSWHSLRDHDFISILLPLTFKAMGKEPTVETFIVNALENTDRRVGQGLPVIPAYFFAVVLWHAYQYQRSQEKDLPRAKQGVVLAAEKIFRQQYPTIAIPKRVSSIIIDIWDLQWHLVARRRKSVEKLLDNRRFRAAFDFLLLRQGIGEVDDSITSWWSQIQELDEEGRQAMINKLEPEKPRRRRREK